MLTNFSNGFLKFIGRLSIAGVVVLSGLHFGSAFFVSNISRETEIRPVKNLSEQVKNHPVRDMILSFQGEERIIPVSIVENFFEPYIRNYSKTEDVRISPKEVSNYLESIAPFTNIQQIDAKFTIVNGRAEEFRPSTTGLKLNIEESVSRIMSSLANNSYHAELSIDIIEPDITLDKINELGITTLIGRGESDFRDSPASRVHNIEVGSAKYNGEIIKPGEEFSFNSILGEVDEKNGYQSELVIKGGKLVYEYGGGLCQVSTTVFRAAIMAGLPIVERRPHSFPVRYYDPQGYDATIYPGVVDFKFKNDTPNHILVQSRIEGTKLFFDIYGPDDGRKVVLEGPFQYDQKTNGSMKAYFTRKVSYDNGATEEKRFDSSYGAPAPLEKNPLE